MSPHLIHPKPGAGIAASATTKLAGLASHTHAGKSVWKREDKLRKGLEDEMIVLGT